MRRFPLLAFALATLIPEGCHDSSPSTAQAEREDTRDAIEHSHRSTAASIDTERLLAYAEQSSIIVIGELHDSTECVAQTIEAMRQLSRQSGCLVLVLELFERDMQSTLDAFAAGAISYENLSARAHLHPVSAGVYHDLLRFAVEERIAIVAGNAPRRLIQEFRESELPYDEFLLTVSANDAQFLPRSLMLPDVGETKHFYESMIGLSDRDANPHHVKNGSSGGGLERYLSAQMLWDESLAEVIASHRTATPGCRTVLLAGNFHLGPIGGALRRVVARRPVDGILTIRFRQTAEGLIESDFNVVVPPSMGSATD